MSRIPHSTRSVSSPYTAFFVKSSSLIGLSGESHRRGERGEGEMSSGDRGVLGQDMEVLEKDEEGRLRGCGEIV